MTRVLATAILTLWIANHVLVKQEAHGSLAKLVKYQGVLVGLLLAICIL